jgi:hypothetical protein
MAKKVVKKNIRSVKKTAGSPFNIYWEKKHYQFLFLGFILLIVGYFFMSQGSWDSFSSLIISPVILFLAYMFIFPASILYRKRETADIHQDKEIDPGKS